MLVMVLAVLVRVLGVLLGIVLCLATEQQSPMTSSVIKEVERWVIHLSSV